MDNIDKTAMIMIRREEYNRLQYIYGILDACKILAAKGDNYSVKDVVDTLLLGMDGYNDLGR